ncbi:MAG: radical SAM protein [Magnetococcales bacterium]|nr:radical SAM protein [Magnetococcales bacterium]
MKKRDIDIILIAQSNVIDNNKFSTLPKDRLSIYKNLVYPRLVRVEDRLVSHLDYINYHRTGRFYSDVGYIDRRQMLNIWNLPSMGGMHLANYLTQFGFSVKIINNFDSEFDIFTKLYQNSSRPPLVGISTTFYLSWAIVGGIVKRLRDIDNDMKVALGGAFVNSEFVSKGASVFEGKMKKYKMNYVLYAFNSEMDLRNLMLYLEGKCDYQKIRNFCALDSAIEGGSYFVSSSQWNSPLLELKDVPAQWHSLDIPFVNSTVQIRTASGCPFKCSFCSYPTTAGGWFTVDEQVVERHLESVLSIPGVNKIIFIDDTFNVPSRRFVKLLKLFSKFNFEWFSFLRVQYVNEEMVKMMRDTGCRGVYLGIESANDTVLQNMNKKVTIKQFADGVNLLNKFNIDYLAAFVLGFPGESYQTIVDNIRFIRDNGVKYYSLKEFYYMDNTSIHEKRFKYGLSGIGKRWRHDTMSYEQASDLKLELFSAVNESIHVDPDTSLWYMAYLYDQGFSFADIADMQKRINRDIKVQISGEMKGLEGYKDCVGKKN